MRAPFVPLVLMLEPLFACNLNCATCGRVREYRNLASQMMSVEECLESSRECGAPIVSICGGEPLIYPAIDELVAKLIEAKRYIYLCTNGLNLAKASSTLKLSGRLVINVHLDGPPEIHDEIVSHKGAYEAAVAGIKAAVGRGFRVTINTTVCKQTDMEMVDLLMSRLAVFGVSSFMISPAYSYDSVEDKECFMSREEARLKFAHVDQIARKHRLSNTPVYLDFLKGARELTCTAWGNPTRNVAGWRSPCYLIADKHYPSYDRLVNETDWCSYGIGRDPRCADCLVHCGFEPTAALMLNKKRGDLWRMLRWHFS
jgi:hopanoid biosynthesis associated radical SAM protein HpnH